MEPLEDMYFRWLCAHVQHVQVPTPSTTRWNLLRYLHGQPFVWIDGYDENRAEDGVELRAYFSNESRTPLDPSWLHQPCSVLEMLVALAVRCEFNSMLVEPVSWWFWHLTDNLGIDYPDAVAFPEDHVEMVLNTWMYRAYDQFGVGGLFPLQHPNQDQRHVEIWYQMMAYLEEKGW